MQVLPTAPSPTVTHLMNLEALIAVFVAGRIKANGSCGNGE